MDLWDILAEELAWDLFINKDVGKQSFGEFKKKVLGRGEKAAAPVERKSRDQIIQDNQSVFDAFNKRGNNG